MSYDNLRKGRHSAPGQMYLVTTVTAARRKLFADFTTARRVIAEMRRMHEGGNVISMAWVLMPDHLHWLSDWAKVKCWQGQCRVSRAVLPAP